MTTSSNSNNGGIGFVGLLTIVFITLKLTGTIAWSWWWVLSPLWISPLLVLIILIGIICIGLLSSSDHESRWGKY